MESAANVRLYQSDYDKIKKIADKNHISLAEVISSIISNYEQMLAGPQVVMRQMNFGGDPNDLWNESNS